MELEKVTAEIRPRTPWEAIDLGIRLTAVNATTLLKGWMGSVYPLALLILAVSHQAVGWGVFLIWWLKPVWERVVLFALSRNLFGETPTSREMMKVLPREMARNGVFALSGLGLALAGWWIHSGMDDGSGSDEASSLAVFYWLVVLGLLFYRSGPNRALALPIRDLEGQQGTDFRARLRILSFRGSGAGFVLMLVCLLMELALLGSQIVFTALMIPQGMESYGSILVDAVALGDLDLIPGWVWVLTAVFYLNAMTIMAWFYTGAGFGLYVNTRTWTEGWDIELKFRGLGRRLGFFVVCFLVLSPVSRVEANEDVRRILDRDEFRVETREIYEDKDAGKESASGSTGHPGVFAEVGNAFFWIVIIVIIAAIIVIIAGNTHLLKGGGQKTPERGRRRVTTVNGLNIEPENLPVNVIDVARKLWREGRHHEALGLLYRSAISFLVARQLVEIGESDTELACLRRVSEAGEVAHASYFERLTEAWISEAYAGRTPGEQTAAALWQDWPFEGREKG